MSRHLSSIVPPSLRTPLLALAAGIVAAALLAAGPLPLPPGYHDFADVAVVAGLPHAGDVLSNLPFLVVGLLGLAGLGPGRGRPAHGAWRVFFVAIAVTAFGSAWYHLAPGDDRLALDRLPIAWACAALLIAFLAERVDPRWGRPAPLAAAVALASLAVLHAWLSTRWLPAGGDQRVYLLTQAWPLVLVPIGCALWPAPAGGLRDRDWCLPLLLYVLAKALEVADHAVLAATGIASGHSLKHLVAAGAALVLALACRRARGASEG